MITDTFNRPLKDLRISVIDRCNFRCAYCMPEEKFGTDHRFLRKGELLTSTEIIRLARIIVNLGASKIRLTGGEPLLRPDIDQLITDLVETTRVKDIGITTNGYLLPQKAKALKNAGLKRVNISLDTLDDAIFRHMNGNKASIHDVLSGIEAAQRAELSPIKINTVVQRGINDHTVLDLVRFCKENRLIVRFIEYMDVGTLNGWELSQVISTVELINMIDAEIPLDVVEDKSCDGVAQRYTFRDGNGEIGMIPSVTQPFCGNCTRLRLSADGHLYTCLFSTTGIDLRSLLRQGASDEDIQRIITDLWQQRIDRYSELRSSETNQQPRVEMYHIGG